MSGRLHELSDGSTFHELFLHYTTQLFQPTLLESPKKLFYLTITHSEFSAMKQVAASTGFLDERFVSLSFKRVEQKQDTGHRSYTVLQPFLCGPVMENNLVKETFVPTTLRIVHFDQEVIV